MSAGIGSSVMADAARSTAFFPLSTAILIGGLLAGTLGLIAGLAFGEPRATRTTTDALRSGKTDGEVAVRFDAPAGERRQVAEELRRHGATEVGDASHGAPGRAQQHPS